MTLMHTAESYAHCLLEKRTYNHLPVGGAFSFTPTGVTCEASSGPGVGSSPDFVYVLDKGLERSGQQPQCDTQG